jgi:hypothetical protein
VPYLARQRGWCKARCVRLSTLLILAGTTACHSSAQVNASGSVNGKADPFAELDRPEPFGETPTSDGLRSVDEALGQSSGARLALMGARHDLSVKEGVPASCECVAFVAAAPTDNRFEWEGPPPLVQVDDQVAVAFRADSACLAGKAGPSYRGYVKDGANVVLLLEDVHPGRPELRGAIVPRPAAGGDLLVRTSAPDAAYGKALDGSNSLCVVEYSGGARARPPAPAATLRRSHTLPTAAETPPPDALDVEE